MFHTYNTRTKEGLHIDFIRSSLGQRCIKYKGSVLWNCLRDAENAFAAGAAIRREGWTPTSRLNQPQRINSRQTAWMLDIKKEDVIARTVDTTAAAWVSWDWGKWRRGRTTSAKLADENQQHTHTHTHIRLTALCPGLPAWVSRYQQGKTNLDFTGARDSEWQWNPLGHTQVCTSHQTDNHASTAPLSFLQAGCPSCRPTNSIKALKAFENQQDATH